MIVTGKSHTEHTFACEAAASDVHVCNLRIVKDKVINTLQILIKQSM